MPIIVTFKKPHTFESTEYKDVDLSALENLSTRDLINADSQFAATGQFAMLNEMTTGYCLIVAAQASSKPIEFFESLPAKEGLKVKNAVMGFLND